MLLNYHIRRLVLSSLCVGDLVRLVLSGARVARLSRKFTLTLIHASLQNKTADVVVQQHSLKLLMMDILISETC